MAEYLTVAEVYAMQSRLIDLFGGLHSVRDKGAVEAAVFRPQTGYYNSLEEEAAALMESLGNNHGFLDGNKRIAFAATDTFLRINGFYLKSSLKKRMSSIMAQWIDMSLGLPRSSAGSVSISRSLSSRSHSGTPLWIP